MADPIVKVEMQGSPIGRRDARTNRGDYQARFMCAWADREALITELINAGVARPENSAAVPYAGSWTPFTDEANLGATDVAAYEKAIVTMEYATPDFSSRIEDPLDSGQFVSVRYEPTAEYMKMGSKGMTWLDGTDVDAPETPPILLLGADLVTTLYDKAYTPDDLEAFDDAIGKVNSLPVTARILLTEYAAETLLFNPYSIVLSTYVAPPGPSRFDVTFRFSIRPNTWNKFYHPKSGLWENMNQDGDLFIPFKSIAF